MQVAGDRVTNEALMLTSRTLGPMRRKMYDCEILFIRRSGFWQLQNVTTPVLTRTPLQPDSEEPCLTV